MENSGYSLSSGTLPAQLGRYEVIAQLGAGGMARVYLALQRGPFLATKLVVLKQLRREVLNEEQLRAMFVDEARIAVRLNHPNVVHTYEAVADPGEYYIVMEYLEGQSLAHLLRSAGREKVSVPLHVWILSQVLAGLQYAHELRDFDGTPLGIVHRDVSPSNVFVTYAGEVKLVDFGIAKISGSVAESQQGIMKGKIGYASPEQCLAKPADVRSDVYAVGVMLWEALARRRRAAGETALAMMQARVENKEPAIEELWPDVPPELAAMTRRALAQEPDERFPTALDFQRELERYLAQIGYANGPAELSELMTTHFASEISALKRLIEEQVSVPRADALGSGFFDAASMPPPPPELASGSISSPTVIANGPFTRPWSRLAATGFAAAAVVSGTIWFSRAQPSAESARSPASAPQAIVNSSLPPPALSAEPVPAAASPVSGAVAAEPSANPAASAPHHGVRALINGRRAPATAKSATVPEPGSDLRTRAAPHPLRNIDEGDPYRQ